MNPIYASDEQQLDFIGIGMEILRVARNELYLNMRFLDVALSSLQFVPDGQIRPIGTDGVHLYFYPELLLLSLVYQLNLLQPMHIFHFQ